MRELSGDLAPALTGILGEHDEDSTPVAVDLRGYDSAEIVLSIGVGGIIFDGTDKVELVLTHSDDNIDYAPVAANEVSLGAGMAYATGGIILSLIAAHAAAATYRAAYLGTRRYLKLLADFGGEHEAATAMSAIVIRGRAAR